MNSKPVSREAGKQSVRTRKETILSHARLRTTEEHQSRQCTEPLSRFQAPSAPLCTSTDLPCWMRHALHCAVKPARLSTAGADNLLMPVWLTRLLGGRGEDRLNDGPDSGLPSQEP